MLVNQAPQLQHRADQGLAQSLKDGESVAAQGEIEIAQQA